MVHYFEGLMRQTGLIFGPVSSIAGQDDDRGRQPILPVEYGQRNQDNARSDILEHSMLESEGTKSPDGFVQTNDGLETQSPLHTDDAHELDESIRSLELARAADAPKITELEADQIESKIGAIAESPALVPTSEAIKQEKPLREGQPTKPAGLHVVKKEQRKEEVQTSESHSLLPEPPSSPPELQREKVLQRGKSAENKSSVEARRQPVYSSGQQVVRQVLEWIGEKEPPEKTLPELESSVQSPSIPMEQEIAYRQSQQKDQNPTVVERQQTLQLSIGSIVMTVEGSPTSVEQQPKTQQELSPAQVAQPKPPLQLSRYYLRIR